MYIPRDPPLVLHIPTSWQPPVHPVTFPHACAEVGLCLDLNGQPPRQKTNALPLCQRPGLISTIIYFYLFIYLVAGSRGESITRNAFAAALRLYGRGLLHTTVTS